MTSWSQIKKDGKKFIKHFNYPDEKLDQIADELENNYFDSSKTEEEYLKSVFFGVVNNLFDEAVDCFRNRLLESSMVMLRSTIDGASFLVYLLYCEADRDHNASRNILIKALVGREPAGMLVESRPILHS